MASKKIKNINFETKALQIKLVFFLVFKASHTIIAISFVNESVRKSRKSLYLIHYSQPKILSIKTFTIQL